MTTIIPAKSVPAFPTPADQTGISKDDAKMAALRKASTELEAAFLTEMLKSAGFGKARDAYGGGAGEDQFGSLLVRAQAQQMTRAGGIGLAESLYHALLEAENDTSGGKGSD